MRLLTIGLIVSLIIHYSDAKNCVLDGGKYDGTISIFDPKQDDNADVFLVIPTENVEKAETHPTQANFYTDVVYSENTLTFKPSAEFKTNWEKDTAYSTNPRVYTKFIITCTDGDSYDLDFYQSINDLNTFPPTFLKTTYDFKIPMPVGGNVDLTPFGEAIFAMDYDVANEGMDFKIEGEDADLLAVEYVGRSDPTDNNCDPATSTGKTHKGMLKTKSPLRLTKDTTYTITAIDKGKPNTLSGTAQLNIIIDESGTLPSSPSFETGFYEADYDKSNPDQHSITLKKVIKVTEGITTENIQLSGEHAENFEHTVKDNTLEITLKTKLPDDVINFQPFVALSISALIENAEVAATTSLIVIMPEKDSVSFTKVYYETQYSQIEGNPQIDRVDILVTENADVQVIGDYMMNFKYNPTEKIIEPTDPLSEDIQSKNDFIHVTIKATLGIAEAEAVLIVKMPDEEVVKFGKIYYEATYSEESGPTITTVTLDVTDGADIQLGGDLAGSFRYNPTDKTITVDGPLNLESQINNYIHVTITATLGDNTAEAVLIVNWEREEIVKFGQVYYEATYSEEETGHTMTSVQLDFTDGADIQLSGDLAGSFTYNPTDKTITVNGPLDLESQINNYIHVTITATLGDNTAEAVLIVNWETEVTVKFGKVYYEATYSEEETVPTITRVELDVTDGADIQLSGDLAGSFTYNPTDKTITVNGPLDLESQINNYIHVTITATLGDNTAEAVLIVNWETEVTVKFGKVYYEATYSEEETVPTITRVELDVTDGADIQLSGDLAGSFTYNPSDKTISVNEPIPWEDQLNNYIHVTITATLGENTAEAVLIVNWEKGQTVKFGQVYYEATYSEEETVPTITRVQLDVTDGADIQLSGDLAGSFTYNPTDKTITVNGPLDLESQINNYIHVTITATLGDNTAEAVLIVNWETEVTVKFGKVYYEATYSEEETVPTITRVELDVTDGADIQLSGDLAGSFTYNPTDKTITVNGPLDLESQINNYIHVTITATLGDNTAEAVLIVNWETEVTVKFGKVYYEATYSEEETVPTITRVELDVTDGADIQLSGDLAGSFTYNPSDKTISVNEPIPWEDQLNNYIHVTITATLGENTAEAVLIVNWEKGQTVKFGQVYYEATYSEEETVPTITRVELDVTDGADIQLSGGLASSFKYNPSDKTISVNELIPWEDQLNNYIHVTITATLGENTAEAVLIVNWEKGQTVKFGQVYYEATYSEEETVPTITRVELDVTDGADIQLSGGLASLFKYNPSDKTISVNEPIPWEDQLNNYIHVTITATLGENTAEAVLIVNWEKGQTVKFGQVYYEATYSEEETVPTITRVELDVTDGADIQLSGGLASLFKYNPSDKTISVNEPIPWEDQLNNYIHVTITATLGENTAEAVLIVNWEKGQTVKFGKVYYEATYSEEETGHTMTSVQLDFTDGADIQLSGGLASLFKYNPSDKTISVNEPIPWEDQLNNYIHVTITATLGENTAEAVLIVNWEKGQTVKFGKVYYEATYSEEESGYTMTPVKLDFTDGADIQLSGGLASLFKYNPLDKTILVNEPIPWEDQLNNYIHVTITATLGENTAEAVLIVNWEKGQTVKFGQVYYEATYSEEEAGHTMTPVELDFTDGADIQLSGGLASLFKYNPSDKTISVNEPIPWEDQLNNYIHVTITATLGENTAEAVLIVNWEKGQTVKFGQVYYEATYSEEETGHTMTPVQLDFTDGADIQLSGDLADSFTYNPTDKTITVYEPLPLESQPNNFIHVTITATLGENTAEAVLIVSWPKEGTVKFGQVYYETTYSEETITPVKIDVTDGATIEIGEDYADYFKYNSVDKTIETKNPLLSDIQADNNFIHVTIKATLDGDIAEAVLIVNIPNEGNQMNGIFGEIYYEASYFEENGDPKITNVLIDVIDGAEVEIVGEYDQHFEYVAGDKSIKILKALDINSFEKWFIHVTIRATFESSTADAVLVVSPTAIITFEGELVFEGEPTVGINEKLTAKSTIEEEIVFRLTDNVPQDLKNYLSLTDDGTLKTLDLPTGSYDIEVLARGTTSKATQIALIKIRIGSAETCPDGTIWNPYTFIAANVKENEEESVILPLNAGSEYHYEIVDIQPNKDRFELNLKGDFVAKSLDRESDEFGSGKAQYIAKINLISKEVQRHFSPKSTFKSLFIAKDETTSGDDKCFSINKVGNEPNQILVGISVEDANDNKPTFEKTKVVVGYPALDLLKTVSPPYLFIAKATDKDIGDYASLKYSTTSAKVIIDENTGYIYPTEEIYENDDVVKVIAKDDNGKGNESDEPLSLTIKILQQDHLCILKYQDKHLEDLDGIMDNLAKYADVRYLSASVLPGSNPFSRSATDRSLVITAYAFGIGTENLLTAEQLIDLLEDVDGLTTEPLPNPGEDCNTTPQECTTEKPDECDCGDEECSSNGGLIAGVVVLAILLALCIGGFIAFYLLKFRKTKSYNQMEEEGLPNPATKETPLENPKFIKNPAPLPVSNKPDIVERRPTGYLYPADLAEEEPPITGRPSEVFNNEMKERRKSVAFNNDIEEVHIEREAEDQDGEKKNLPDEAENTKL